jgi:hypothetical protein
MGLTGPKEGPTVSPPYMTAFKEQPQVTRTKPTSYLAIRDHGVRTYGQLIEIARPDQKTGSCCACHKWGMPTWTISTRASICEACCQRKASETLGSIERCERKARRYIKCAIKAGEDLSKQYRFYSHLVGIREARFEEMYLQALVSRR